MKQDREREEYTEKLGVLKEDLKTGRFKSLYLLYGEEAYSKRVYLKRLMDALSSEAGDMNRTVYSETRLNEEEIIGLGETLPFFSERRVILLDGTSLFKGKYDRLADYFGKLPEYLTFVICEETADKRSKLYKAIAKNGLAIDFLTPTEKGLEKWVAGALASDGKRIRQNTCVYFLSKAGSDLNYIRNELDKLVAYTGGRVEVTPEDIDAVCSPVIEDRIFEMLAAAAEKNRKKALSIYRDLLILKESPMKILSLLARQYDQLLRIREMLSEGMGPKRIAEELKMNPYVVGKLVPTANRYSIGQLREAVEDMVGAEEAVKTGKLDERISVELMLVKYS